MRIRNLSLFIGLSLALSLFGSAVYAAKSNGDSLVFNSISSGKYSDFYVNLTVYDCDTEKYGDCVKIYETTDNPGAAKYNVKVSDWLPKMKFEVSTYFIKKGDTWHVHNWGGGTTIYGKDLKRGDIYNCTSIQSGFTYSLSCKKQ